MLNFENEYKKIETEDMQEEMQYLKLQMEITGEKLKQTFTATPEFLFLCKKYITLQNTVFSIKKEIDKDQEKKEDKE